MSNLVWQSYKIEMSVLRIANAIHYFREKVDELVMVEKSIEQQLKELDTCEYQEQRFTDRKRRQDDEDSVIRRRGRDEKRANVEPAFAALFEEFLGGVDRLEAGKAQQDGRQLQEQFAKTIKIKQLVLEILIRNQVLHVSPSIEVRSADS
jgi:hypothetical protein